MSRAGRVGAWAGLLAPPLFGGVIFVEGALRPGYDAARMFASALSLGPRGWIQATNFLVTGVLLLLFARGVAAELGRRALVGVALLTTMGCCLLAAGVFVMDDPSVTRWSEMTLHSQLHHAFSAVFFALAPVSCFVFFRRFTSEPAWRRLRWWTLATGIVVTLLIGVFKAGMSSTADEVRRWVGLVQRAILFPYFLWIFAFAWTLLGRTRRS